ncbi:hypothetical protein RB620_24185 [Paenibacillus sp. LHD-117]|uniref:hypothetical protein n=1 Tax=Paenibacillus sp. LHD-117 TaxID=3071412 RepID=UPI0027E13029|nr:hypothetical protein [Paenibacillus sp. LHD-117]MDQ6422534.1 hypothetical protein [Paenibacillus sp. LHD-117]
MPRTSSLHSITSRDGGDGSVKKRIVLPAMLLLSLLLAGCQYTAAPADLLRKPQISADKEQLLAAVTKALPEFSIMMLPHSDNGQEAIRLIDLDGDGADEAVVTYYNEYSSPEIMALRLTENGWRQWLLVEQPLAREMTWLSIEDMDGDGTKELAVGWTGAFDSPAVLELYSFQSKAVRNDKGKLKLPPSASLPFSLAETADLDRDGNTELAVISESSSAGAAAELVVPVFQLTMYTWEDGRLTSKARTTLPEGVSLFDRMIMGNISTRHQGVVLEGGTGAHSLLTFMYAWNGRQLTLVYPTPELEKQGYGFSGKPTFSEDMNGDGIIELQRTWEAPGHEGVPYSDSLWMNEWLQWDGRTSFNKVAEQYVDPSYGIRLDIPESWKDSYTMVKPPRASYGIVTFQYYNAETDEIADLATVYVVPLSQWEGVEHVWRDEKRLFRSLGVHSGNQYAVSFHEDGLESLTAASRSDAQEMLKVRDSFSDYLSIDFAE